MGYSMVRITGSEQVPDFDSISRMDQTESAITCEAVAVAKALLDGRVNEKRANARRDGPGGSSGRVMSLDAGWQLDEGRGKKNILAWCRL